MPHVVFSADFALGTYERVLFSTLLAIEDEFLSTRGGHWFFATNEMIHKRSGISMRQIHRVRERLCRKRLVVFQRGHTGKATLYRILLDDFYRFDKECVAQNLHSIRD